MREIRRTIVICPKCGEDNADNFRFCGMCGTLLEAKPEARRPAGAPVPNLPTIATPVESLPRRDVENAPRPAHKPVPPISGPSMLGLNQPVATQPTPYQPTHPSMESLREKSFSGLDSFFEPEEPKTGGRRILLLLVLLAALAGSSWWLYTNYLSPADNRSKEPATSTSAEAPPEKPSEQPAAQNPAPSADAASSRAGSTTATAPESPSQTANVPPQPETKPPIPQTTPKSTPQSTPKANPKTAVGERAPRNEIAAKRESSAPARTSKLPQPDVEDTGDTDFRKGEAYLYGRGMPENCDAALKYLRAASVKSNAKARSMLGTMYDTGHCVARDLPTSYLWFALALRADPNNQILEKDLSAVWNQMTPPERQMATRMKQ